MIIRIGTMFLGEVDAVATQSVQTKFFVLGVPLFPVGSFFFTAPGRGFEIPLHGKSVLAGYLRLGLGLGVVRLGIRLLVMRSWHRDALDWLLVFGAAAAFLVSVFAYGRLSGGEARRRMVLLHRTGLGADPNVLPAHVRGEIEGELRARLEAASVPLRPETWMDRGGAAGPYRSSEASQADVPWADLYAYARYASVDDPAWRPALPALAAHV